MYLNTFIGLEENVTGYGAKQKRPSGHITITTPGVIKCYVQDLRPLATKEYVLYVMGKEKNAVRIGKLNDPSQNKQTIWNIDIDNVSGKNIGGKDIDCVAVIIEGDDIGSTDTVMLGYSKDKYLIASILEKALPKKKTEKKDMFIPKPESTPVVKKEIEPAVAVIEKKEIKSAVAVMEKKEIKPAVAVMEKKEIEPVVVTMEKKEIEKELTSKNMVKENEIGPEICPEDIEEVRNVLNNPFKFFVGEESKKEDSNKARNKEVALTQKIQELMTESPKKENNDIANVLSEFIRAQEASEENKESEAEYLVSLEDKLKELQKSLMAQEEQEQQEQETYLQEAQAQEIEDVEEIEENLDFYEYEIDKKKQDPTLEENTYSRAREIFENSTPAMPFKTRSEAASWVMMSTAELISLPQFSYEWCTQPFITYCFHKFNHLILGKDNEVEQYYVGIPDVYHPSRRYILAIDKVESFRCVEDKNPSAGDYGYWIVRV